MNYPTILFPFQQNKTIHIPDPDKIQETYIQLKSKDDATPFPFWAKIWPSANALSLFLRDHINLIRSKRVLEIGAGIGLPSFSIAEEAKELLITDHSIDAIKLIQHNIDHLKLNNVKTSFLDWNEFPTDLKADAILLSDANYDPLQLEPLLKLIHHFSSMGSTIIISTPERITATAFARSIQPVIKKSILRTVEETGELYEIRIMVL